jgi:hypothetical protein
MAKAIRGHNLATMVPIALVAALLVLVALVFVVRQTATTGDRIETPAMSQGGAGAHPVSEAGAGGSSFERDPAIERHVEIVARHKRSLR